MAYQIDDITAVQTPDPLPTDAVSQPGYFTDGDPSDKGLGATFVPAWWLNMVQGELLSICEKAGISPDKTNNAQVVAAILTLVQQQSSHFLSTLEASINAETQRAEAAEAGLQPKGPYLVGSKNASEDVPALGICIGINGTIPVIKDSTGKLWFLASTDALDAETSRAQAAESQLQNALNAETQRAEAVEAGLQPKGPYVLGSGNVPTDVSVSGLCIGVNGTVPVAKDSTGKLWFLASTDALSAETNRAQAAEAALQPKGHYVVGDGNVPSDTPVQEMCIGINGTVPVIRDAKEKLWFMATTDALTSASNNLINTTLATGGGKCAIQRLTTTISDGQWVGLPWSFADDDVTFIIQPIVSSGYINWVALNYDDPNRPHKNRSGFSAKIWSTNGGVTTISPYTLTFDVIAIGKTS